MATSYGPRYQSGLSKVEIAKLVRLDIKQAVKERTLPKGTYSVRTHSFAGGCSITITVTAITIQVINPQRVFAEVLGDGHSHEPRFTPEARQVLDTLEGLLEAYNYDGSDLQTDYFHVNFYSTVKFAWELEEAQEKGLHQAWQQLRLEGAA